MVDQSERELMRSKLDDPDYWISRAEDVRAIAEEMNDAGRELMLSIAKDYDLLAGLAKSGLQKK